MTYQVIYSSLATKPMSARDLETILADARAGNASRGITGALIYVDGVFLQVLEGEKGDVVGLIESISSDGRHGSMKVFHEAEIEVPTFSSWRMANLDATQAQLARWAGLPGGASMESILAELHNNPRMASQIAVRILEAIYP